MTLSAPDLMKATNAKAADNIDISVSIVSYNTRELLRVCLQSLQARAGEGEASLEIIVVDNGSTDGSIEMVEREFPKVLLRHGHGNIGYGRANNLAFEQAQGRYFWILNSDTEIWPGAIATMLQWMERTPRAGACTGQLILPDGRIQDSCAYAPTLMDVFYEQTRLDLLLPAGRAIGRPCLGADDYQRRQIVDQAVGACLLVRGAAFAQISGFDAAYFMYFEDTDFCVRLRRAGWDIWFLPAARLAHVMGASSSEDWRTRARMVASYNAGRYYFYSRYGGARQAAILKFLVTLGALIRLSIWTGRALLQPHRRAQTRPQVRLFRRVLQRARRLDPRDPTP